MEENIKDKLDSTQVSDKPDNGTEEERISKGLVTSSVDLTTKDAGKWMTAWRRASNVYNPNLSNLYDFYEYVLGMDNTLGGLLKKRMTAVLNKQVIYKNAEGEEVPEMKHFIRSKKFRALLRALLNARQYGRAAIEFVPGKEFDWIELPRKHVKTKWQIISTTQEEIEGYDYTQYWNIWVIDNGDLGELLSCALAAAYKKDAVGDWAELIEGYGKPTEVFMYTLFNPQVQSEIDQIMSKAGSARKYKLPDGVKYEHHENKGGNSTGDAQLKLIDILNKEMAIKQVGGTETTGTSNGSGHAQATVHYAVQQEVIKEDMDYLIELLNEPKFFNVLKSFGIPVLEGGEFDFDREIDLDQITKLKEVIRTGKELGLRIGQKFVHESLGIPEPEEEELLLEDVEYEEVDESEEQPPKKKRRDPNKPPMNLNDSRFRRVMLMLRDFFVKAPQRRGR